MRFIKGYQRDKELRVSFNELAKSTFSIDFEDWYQKGFWNGNYIPYSYFEQGKCVSNASINLMSLIIDDAVVRVGQIGTVMTHEDYRGRGFAQDLIEKIVEDNRAECEVFFLCAEKRAYGLYERCGFEHRIENSYVVDMTAYSKIGKPLEPVALSPELFIEAKLSSKPLSRKLSSVDDVHVALFYYNLGFDKTIYELERGTYVIFEIEESKLYLYDIYSKKDMDIEMLLTKITPMGVKEVHLMFIPDQQIKGLSVGVGNGDWMQKSVTRIIPAGYKIPDISRT